MTEYGQRLREARKGAKLTQMGLSKKTGIPQSTISTAETEGYSSTDTAVYAQACGVSALWLATGDGPKHPQTQSSPALEAPAAPQIDDFSFSILHAFAELPPDPVLKGQVFMEIMDVIRAASAAPPHRQKKKPVATPSADTSA